MIENFKVKGYIEDGIITNSRNEHLDIAAMPPVLRTLLVTDGTVTKTLSAYFWEDIHVEQMGQHLEILEEDMEHLSCRKGDEVLIRNVRLHGKKSGDIYAYCPSIINLSCLPEEVRQQLVDGNIGIGEILRDKGLETYRQVIDVFREIKQEVLPGSSCHYSGEMICRTYIVHFDHKPVIQVTEKFPYRLYQKRR